MVISGIKRRGMSEASWIWTTLSPTYARRYSVEGLEKQIKEVYRLCCEYATYPKDEIFLPGFSRGAFAVRAVANIIHYMQMPKASSNLADFDDFYLELLRLYPEVQSQRPSSPGNIDHYLSKTRPLASLPSVKFVGAFDTVRHK